MLTDKVNQTIDDDFAGILPAQYFDSRRKRKLLEGEYRLLVAVLEDAVHHYLASINCETVQQRLLFEELRAWFHTPVDTAGDQLFTFESICELLGINAAAFRARLDALSVRDLPKRHHPVRHPAALGLHRARHRRNDRRAAHAHQRASSQGVKSEAFGIEGTQAAR